MTVINRAWLGEDGSLTESESHYVFAWRGGYKVIDLTNRPQFYAVLTDCVHDLMVTAYQQGFSKGSADGYTNGFNDGTAAAGGISFQTEASS